MKNSEPGTHGHHASRRHRRQRGFSLPEVLVGLGLLGMASLGVMSFVVTSLRLNKLSVERSVATGVASERVHQLTSMPYQSAANYTNYTRGAETAATVTATENGVAVTRYTYTVDYGDVPGYPEYRRVLTLQYDTPVSGMLRAECAVSWNNTAEGEKTHTMVAYLHPDLERAQ